MGFVPNPEERTVRILVEFIEGQPRAFYGGTWPPIKDGSIGELDLPAVASGTISIPAS